MSGMDRLNDEWIEETIRDFPQDEDEMFSDEILLRDALREILAHRRASQAAPAPSDGLREAWIAGRDAAASVVAEGWAENRYQEEIDAALIALTPPAALTPAPAQEGGE